MRTKAYYELGSIWADWESTNLVLSQDFRHIELNVLSSWVTTWHTITVYKSDQLEQPNITSPVSSINKYTTVQIVNKDDGNPIDGSTWIGITNNGMTTYEINDNLARWIWVRVTSYTDGNSDISISMSNNN